MTEEKMTNPYTTDQKAIPAKGTSTKSTNNPYKSELLLEQVILRTDKEFFELSEKRKKDESKE